MKKMLIILFGIVFLLSGCFGGSSEPSGYFASDDEISDVPTDEPVIEEPVPIIREMPKDEELIELLLYQVELYERGNYGFKINRNDDSSGSWMFAAAFADDLGAKYIDSKLRTDLIRILYSRWLGVYSSEVFSYVSPSDTPISVACVEYEIKEDGGVVLVVSRIRGGIEMLDSQYVFARREADEEILGSDAKNLTLGGYYWSYESVTPLEDTEEYEFVTISTPEELIAFSVAVNNRVPEAVNGNFALGNDIDMTGYSFEPIGKSYPDEWYDNALLYAKVLGGFNGEFDGAGHKITGIDIVFAENNPMGSNTGFFGQIGPKAYIHDLTVCGSVSDGGKSGSTQNGRVGGFAGKICGGAVVENCRFEGKVDGYSYVGGFAGQIGGDRIGDEVAGLDAVVINCSSNAEIVANLYSGGFVGSVWSEIKDCSATGTLKITNKGTLPSGIGGFAGDICDGDIRNCKSAVRLEYEYSEPNRMGNFAGELSQADIINCIIDPDCIHDGWYMVGMQWYKGRTIEVKRENWYEEPSDVSAKFVDVN